MNVDRIATIYRFIEYGAFGGLLQRCRCALLERVKDRRAVLIAGEGDGRFLACLLAINPRARCDVIDASGRMIELARTRIGGSDHIRFFQRDALDGPLPSASYDLVVTNFFLDCLSAEHCRRWIDTCAGALVPGGLWLVSEFEQPARGWAAVHAWLWLRVMYLFFRLTTGLNVSALPPWRVELAQSGLTQLEERTFRFGLLASSLWQKPF